MQDIVIPSSNVNIIETTDMQTAASAAAEESANTGGFHLPGVLFKQGNRYCISTAIPIRRARSRLLDVNEARAKGTVADVIAATNRPVMQDHVSNISEYLKENVGSRYILPPMTLNVRQPISVYMPKYAAAGQFGSVYLVIPETAGLSVTDGGHRTKAIIKASENMTLDDLAMFDQDAVSVMITLESDLVQVHQDFADCSKTKPLPKSQLAAYDRRNPANGLVLELIERCPLFNDKIDSTSQTLSKTSRNLFLTNQVRQLVKELLVGDYAMADDYFEDKAKEILIAKDNDRYNTELEQFVNYVNCVTGSIPVLKEIAELPTGTPRNIISDRRAEGWICLTATGMVLIGRIGHELFKERIPNWTEVARRIGEVDWGRYGELWQGNIVRSGKLTTQRAPVRVAAEKLRRAIGLPPNAKLDAELAGHVVSQAPLFGTAG